jgi:hypothetical protein
MKAKEAENKLFSICELYCHPDKGGAKFLRNVDSYKSHTA